ncbi:HNH endonuclease [Bacteroides congonensis]|uniref:HNH endonuclease n=1 Tax=Bacteroides congonensis TaxID=1871006 RepID=UPI000933FCAC|nr:HNH endonuclease [Bacteroides congonensis]
MKMINYDKLEKISEPCENWKYLIAEDRKKNEDFVVSNFGRIYSTKYNRLVKLYHNKHTGYDYFFINEYRDKDYDTMNVHRAVALTWLDIPTDLKDDYYVVDHKNEVKADNRVTNLQWITHQENVTRATAQERKVENYKKTVEIRKLIQEKDAEIERLTTENKILKERLLKYEDKVETALALNQIGTKKKKLDYKQFI